MNSPVSLGIDLGTSELKAILMDATGAVLAHAGVRLSVSRRHSGWSEQAPEDWWQACLQALQQLRQHQAFTRVACIGLSGQMALVGFDDFEWADFFVPRLSLIAQPVKALGARAVDLLLQRMAAPDAPPQSVRLAPTLQLRNSCGCS